MIDKAHNLRTRDEFSTAMKTIELERICPCTACIESECVTPLSCDKYIKWAKVRKKELLNGN